MIGSDYKLSGQFLKTCSQVKCVGHVTDNEDMLYVRANVLCRKFGQRSDEVKLTLFKVYCKPFYTAHLQSNYKKERVHGGCTWQTMML